MKPTLRIAKLTDITPDPKNANRHSPRGRDSVERSLRERGFFRPMAAAGKGVTQPVMIAGNLTQETAVDLGMEEAIIIETDGTRPIVHVRTDVEPGTPEAIMLGLEDNRSAELSLDWDSSILNEYKLELGTLAPLWTDQELETMANIAIEPIPPDNFASYDESIETQYQCPKCHYEWSGKPK